MAWFALNPPVGVQIIPFFITARWSGQNDRATFAEVVTEQCVELLGEPMPSYLTDATRDTWFLDVLERAAAICQQRGERLVLLVDGLDEDRGVTAGPDAYSIAAMLPPVPPNGLRIIVAGRPNPPIPTDVPDDHPLRDAAIARRLEISPVAQAGKNDMLRELATLLQGTPDDRDLLGLVAAAGGGLSAGDLAELTDRPLVDVSDHLTTVAGRSFTPRYSSWRPDGGPELYVLGHEDLQQTAIDRLGAERLDSYRQRLHSWADGYRARGWPTDTPEYLLRGYYYLLRSAQDVPRMLVCASDLRRHDLMLHLVGGDTAAFAEIHAAGQALLHQDSPDLLAAARLALHRDRLVRRNSYLPIGLPALWLAAGQRDRALALALSIPGGSSAAGALLEMARVAVRNGDREHLDTLVSAGIDLIDSLSPDDDFDTWSLVLELVAIAGDLERADALASRAPDSFRERLQCEAVAEIAAAGGLTAAERIARTIRDGYKRARSLTAVATAVATAGDQPRARRVAEEAASVASALALANQKSIATADLLCTGLLADEDASRLISYAEAAAQATSDAEERASALMQLAHAVAVLGDRSRSSHLFDLAETASRSVIASNQGWITTDLVRQIARSGDLDRAESLAGSITLPTDRLDAMTALAESVAGGSDPGRVDRLIEQAKSLAASCHGGTSLTELLVQCGQLDGAERAARASDDAGERAEALTLVASAVATGGDIEHAMTLAADAEDCARSAGAQDDQIWAAAAIDAKLTTGEVELAVRIAGSIADPERRAEELHKIARDVLATGNRGLVPALCAELGETVSAIDDLDDRAWAMLEMASLVAAMGQLDQAEEIARSIAFADRTVDALLAIARAAAEWEPGREELLLEDAERLARSISDQWEKAIALTDLARTMADLGKPGRFSSLVSEAEMLARTPGNDLRSGWALSYLVRAIAASGDLDRGQELARTIGHSFHRIAALLQVAQAAERGAEPLYREAADLAIQAAGDEFGSPALALVAKMTAERGYLELAARVVDNILWPEYQDRARLDLIRALVTGGEIPRAVEVSDQILVPKRRAEALTVLAGGAKRKEACRFLLESLCIRSDQPPLALLGELDPEALSAIVAELLDDKAA